MEFRILGPLEVRDAGQPLPLGGVKQRALLAILLLHANDLLSNDRLIDELWGEEAPETARNVIQVYVSQLRKILATGTSASADRATLITRQPGYVLNVAPEDYDLARFERLAARGRASLEDRVVDDAIRSFDDALALWRGEPLADFRMEPFAQREIERLEEMRIVVHEDLVEAHLECGRGAQLVSELEELVTEYPLRERLRGHLMQALYQAGRQAEALAVYQEGATRLAEELGIDPGPALQHLHEAILRQDPSLVPVAAAAAAAARSDDGATLSIHERTSVVILAAASLVDGEAFRRVVTAAGGTVLTEDPTNVSYAVFGYPERSEDDAERAALAASVLASWGEPPAIALAAGRIAIHGSDGDPLRPVRETATALARSPGRIALDDEAARRLRSQFTVEDDADATWLAEVDRSDRSIPTSPLIGRDREREELEAILQELRSGRGQVVMIEGETGLGKTRMLWEARSIAGDATEWLQGSCSGRWMSTPYLALSTAIRDFFAIADESDQEARRRHVRAAIGDPVAEAGSVVDALEPLLSAADPVDDDPADRLTAGLRRVFERLAANGPVVLAIDDVHQIDDATRIVLTDLLSLTEALPIGVFLTIRPDPSSNGWPLWMHVESSFRHRRRRIELRPLKDADAGSLADALSPTGVLDQVSRDEIVARAEGNPLYVEELTSALLDDGGFVRGTGWTLSLTAVSSSMPPRLEDLLAMRLQRLPIDARQLAQAAAVLADDAPVDLLALVADVEDPSDGVGCLLRSQIMREASRAPGLVLRFHHGLLRDAALTTLTPERARAMYSRAAEAVSADDGERLERTAFYRYRAGEWKEASNALRASAERAEQTSSHHAADLWAMAARAAEHLGDTSAAANARARAERLRTPEYRGQFWHPDQPDVG